MVKNKSGGKRSKGLARKDNSSEVAVTTKIRFKEDAAKEAVGLYYYAKVTKCLGNCRFLAACDDGTDRVASCLHFGKKNRRENNIDMGANLLVGVAEYNTATHGKQQPCQILDLYSPAESAYIPYFQSKDDLEYEDELKELLSLDNETNNEPTLAESYDLESI